MISPIAQKLEIEYPESDGEPMGETETHINQLIDFLIHPLKEFYRDRADVYVVGNIFLYYEEGNPTAVVAPDAFVVFGVPKVVRRTYKLWEEGKAPDVVFELTSKKTYRADLGDKRFLYEELGVREYFLFDPLNEFLRPSLQGYRLVEGYYMPLVPEQVAPDQWQMDSKILGLTLRTEEVNLRLLNPTTGQYLLSRSEEGEARRMEMEKRLLAEEKLAEAEAEIARLKQLLDQE